MIRTGRTLRPRARRLPAFAGAALTAVAALTAGDVVRQLLRLCHGVRHRHSQTGPFQHPQVNYIVAHIANL